MQRQNWLQRNQAAHIVNLLAESMSGGKQAQSSPSPRGHNGVRAPSQGKKVSGGDLLNMMSKRTA